MITSIRGLRAFCICAKCLSFKHAASQLFLTPSAVSHQIKDLEENLGVKLFHRKTRAIELTEAGHQLYYKVNPVLFELENVLKKFQQQAISPSLEIGMPEFFASELFVPKLNLWSEQNPDVNLQVQTFRKGYESAMDSPVSIMLSSTRPQAILVEELFKLKFVVAATPEIASKVAQEGVSILNSVPLLLHEARPWAWHQWAEDNNMSHFDPKQILQFDSMYAVVKAAQQGAGIALIPMPLSHNWLESGQLSQLFDEALMTRDCYYLVCNQVVQPNSPINELINWVKSTFANEERLEFAIN